MTDTEQTEQDATPGLQPARFHHGDTGEFTFQLVLRNADGSYESLLTEVEGKVSSSSGAQMTKADLYSALTETFDHMTEVFRSVLPGLLAEQHES